MSTVEKNPVTPTGFQIFQAFPGAVAKLTGKAKGGDTPAVGNIGDRIQRVIINIANPATANVSVLDGNIEYQLVMPNPTPAGAVTSIVGPFIIELGIYSLYGAWSIRCGPGASAVVIGVFS